ncbi:putative stress response RCI peptide [Xylaria nigripes]|nr:putative stress response RCI peptide [Xylaria nigripes]
MCGPDLFMGLLAILFPPLAVWVKCGICSADSVINILLCMLGYIPGLLHAWYIIAQYPDSWSYESVQPDSESGYGHSQAGVTYVVVPAAPYQQEQQHQQQQQQIPQHQAPQPKPSRGMNYGTNNHAAASASHQDNRGSNTTYGNEADGAPPSYAEAIQGDHKIQSQD